MHALALTVHCLDDFDNAFSVICIFYRRSIPLQIPYLAIHTDYEKCINYHESQATIQCHLNVSKEMICERAHSGIVVKCVGGMLCKPPEHRLLQGPVDLWTDW